MIFKKGERNFQNLLFYLGNKEIKIVNGYTYQGIRFTRSGLFCEAAEQIASKSNIASLSTLSLINRSGIYSLGTVIKLFNSLVESVSLYGCEVWSVSYLDHLIRIQSKFFKSFLFLPTCSPHYAVRFEMQLDSIECKVLKLILNWIAKILKMGVERFPKALLFELFAIDSDYG